MARGRSFRGTGKKIDFKQWDAAPGSLFQIQADATTLGGGLSFSIPATILRFRGYVSAFFDATGLSVGDRMCVAVGVAIVSTDAFTLGATAMPDPAGEPDYPWIWWKEFCLHSEQTAAHSAYGIGAQRYELDSKAMRKIKPGETVTTIVQSTFTAGAPGVEFDLGQLRMLIGT